MKKLPENAIYPFLVKPGKPRIDDIKIRLDEIGRRTVTPELDPENDFFIVTAVAPYNGKDDIFDSMTLLVRRRAKLMSKAEMVRCIETIWGTTELYKIIDIAVNSRWELDDEFRPVLRRIGGGIYSVDRERAVLLASIVNALDATTSADAKRLVFENFDRCVDIIVKSLRVVWSDIAEQMKSYPLVEPMIGLRTSKVMPIRESGKKRHVLIPDVTEDMLCPAYRKILSGVPEGIRDFSAFAVVTLLREIGVPKERAMRILMEWNKRNTPPLEEKEVIEKVEYHYSNEYTPPSCEWIYTHCGLRGNPPCPENCKYRHPFEFLRKRVGVDGGE